MNQETEIERREVESQGHYLLWRSSECLISHAKSEQHLAYKSRDKAKEHLATAVKIIEDLLSMDDITYDTMHSSGMMKRIKQFEKDAEVKLEIH